MKICSKCGNVSDTKKKHGTVCKSCAAKRQREWRARTLNKGTFLYERESRRGFVMRVYRNMKSRVHGISPRGRDRYVSLPLIEKEAFYKWALNDKQFNRLFTAWQKSGKIQKIVPSIDRKNPKRGYVKDNLQWLTLSENSSRGGKNK